MRQRNLIQPVRSVSEVELPVTYKCPYCKNLVTQTYQDKACKACLLAEFKRLRPLQDFVIGTRYISNPDESSTTISASLPAGRELFLHDTLELVEPVRSSLGGRESVKRTGGSDFHSDENCIEVPTPIVPWMHFHRKRYLSSTYPKRY